MSTGAWFILVTNNGGGVYLSPNIRFFNANAAG